MTVIDVGTMLLNTRNRLKELGEAVENLVSNFPDVFNSAKYCFQSKSGLEVAGNG